MIMDKQQRARDEAEFSQNVDRSGDCHLWLGSRDPRGYGRFKRRLATHWALEIAGFDRPSSLHGALHACDNPCCVNPLHLRWGTQKENAADASERRRYRNAQKTHCPKGHPYSTDNLIMRRRVEGWADRHCRICDKARKVAARQRSKVA